MIATRTSCTRRSPKRACRRSSIPGIRAWAPACAAAAASGSKYGNPMYVDDVAVDFPDMPIILAHPSWPWQDEALSIAMHKPQVYIDLSGWSPKYFPPQLVQYANTQLKHKMLFGSDYPWITPDRWLADFEDAGFKPEVKPLILKENAIKLLKLRA